MISHLICTIHWKSSWSFIFQQSKNLCVYIGWHPWRPVASLLLSWLSTLKYTTFASRFFSVVVHNLLVIYHVMLYNQSVQALSLWSKWHCGSPFYVAVINSTCIQGKRQSCGTVEIVRYSTLKIGCECHSHRVADLILRHWGTTYLEDLMFDWLVDYVMALYLLMRLCSVCD